jgi:hypothetical protein
MLVKLIWKPAFGVIVNEYYLLLGLTVEVGSQLAHKKWPLTGRLTLSRSTPVAERALAEIFPAFRVAGTVGESNESAVPMSYVTIWAQREVAKPKQATPITIRGTGCASEGFLFISSTLDRTIDTEIKSRSNNNQKQRILEFFRISNRTK